MSDAIQPRGYQDSRIEDEPILGKVLTLPNGNIQQLTWLEKVLVTLRLTNAKALEARYFKTAQS
ncbi:MAG: hypothetical protein M3Z29_08420 [Pseudomonadota bacterium]|nr:hypothetical protein [Pseudomonadota bacterium]